MGCDGHWSSMRFFGANNRLFDMNKGAMLNRKRRVYFKVLQNVFLLVVMDMAIELYK